MNKKLLSFVYVLIFLFLFFNIVYAQNNQNNAGNKYVEKKVTEVLTDLQKENDSTKAVDKDEEVLLKNEMIDLKNVEKDKISDSSEKVDIDNAPVKTEDTPKTEDTAKVEDTGNVEIQIDDPKIDIDDPKTGQETENKKTDAKSEESKNTTVETKATTPKEDTKATKIDKKAYDVIVLGVKITSLRIDTEETTAEIRAEETTEKLDRLIKSGSIKKIAVRTIKHGYSIKINDEDVFYILKGDDGNEIGDKAQLKEYAVEAVNNIHTVIKQEKKIQDLQELKSSIVKIFLALLITILAFYVMKKLKTIADESMEQWITAILEKISSTEFTKRYSRIFTVYLKRTVLIVYYLLLFLILYIDITVVLAGIPLTRNWANGLLGEFNKIINSFYSGFLKMLPGFIIVIMIMFATKIIVGLSNIFFEGIENNQIKFDWIDKDTIVPTKRITTALLWIVGIALAYPFIPGSGSDAFKGISVLVGVMFSIGSSNVMNQAVSGLIIIYTKGIKVGDYVKVRDYEGIVLHTGVFTVKIKTTSQEEINIPNSVLLDSVTTNYTTLKGEKGIALEIKLGLDYDVPWRQVNAMVLEAVKMTRSLRQDSKPNVFQSDMADYYMEYTVRTWIDRPELRRSIRSELYQNIQDVFNKYDVQIMTPRYLTIYKNKMVVPPDKWYLEPASHNEDDQIEITGLYDAKNADGTPFLKRLNEKGEPKQEDSKQKESKHEEVKEEKKDDRANKKNSGKSKKS